MKFADLILLTFLHSKNSISEIVNLCTKDIKFCKDPKNTNKVCNRMLKVSGYKTDKYFDYGSLFNEMSNISIKIKHHENSDFETITNNILKLTPSFKKALVTSGSRQVHDFLLYNDTKSF